MALAAPAKVSRSPAWILRQDADGTRGQKTAEGDGGRSAPVPEPRAVWLPGYRVQLGADLPILCRAAGSLVAAFSALGADPTEVEKGGREGLPEGAAKAQPRHSQGHKAKTWPGRLLGEVLYFPGHVSPGPGPNLVTPPVRPTGKTSPTEICSQLGSLWRGDWSDLMHGSALLSSTTTFCFWRVESRRVPEGPGGGYRNPNGTQASIHAGYAGS
jgi:hypothetical protein